MRSTIATILLFSLLAGSNAISIARDTTTDNDDDDDGGNIIADIILLTFGVCLPANATDLNAPCSNGLHIQQVCGFGSAVKPGLLVHQNLTDLKEASPEEERVCICGSQFFNAWQGCQDCIIQHGLGGSSIAPSEFTSFSSSYCAVTNTATAAFSSYTDMAFPQSTTGADPYTSDAIGSRTDVSLYYTAPVTGSAAYDVSQHVATGSFTIDWRTVSPSNGQIVATATSVSSSSVGRSSAGRSSAGNSSVGRHSAGRSSVARSLACSSSVARASTASSSASSSPASNTSVSSSSASNSSASSSSASSSSASSSSVGSPSSATSSGLAAMSTPCLEKIIYGAVGLAGAVVML